MTVIKLQFAEPVLLSHCFYLRRQIGWTCWQAEVDSLDLKHSHECERREMKSVTTLAVRFIMALVLTYSNKYLILSLFAVCRTKQHTWIWVLTKYFGWPKCCFLWRHRELLILKFCCLWIITFAQFCLEEHVPKLHSGFHHFKWSANSQLYKNLTFSPS